MDIDKDRYQRRYKTLKEIDLQAKVFQNYVVKCKCSHTVLFTGIKDRIICTNCGNYVYKDKKQK